MAVENFSNRLRSLETEYSSRDIDFVKYVHDHYKNIYETAKEVSLDVNEHYWEHYRLEDFLASKKCDPNIAWIVLYINQIPSNVSFKNIKTLLIPDANVIQGLYSSFLQNRSHIKTCRT